ncbi:MAG: M15 family metallopeptidase [Lachnospiraceae bacterium]|nr:M15 family metallopeptidase [Lachnospiraceae bacterium]
MVFEDASGQFILPEGGAGLFALPSDERDGTASSANDLSSDSSSTDPPLPVNPDRVIYREGFSKEPLTEDIIQKINGVSFHENDVITFDDLSFLRLRYIDFTGTEQNGEMICNKKIADDLLEVFAGLYDAGYQIDKIRLIDEYDGDDDLSCADDNTSCFNFRTVSGSGNLSKHAKGMAVDVNPFYNPYITYPGGKQKISPAGSEPYADRSRMQAHMIDEQDLCYKLFKEHGFTWGGHWKSMKDYQHFEKP